MSMQPCIQQERKSRFELKTFFFLQSNNNEDEDSTLTKEEVQFTVNSANMSADEDFQSNFLSFWAHAC